MNIVPTEVTDLEFLYGHPGDHPIIRKAIVENGWFTSGSINHRFYTIGSSYLNRTSLEKWTAGYEIIDPVHPKNVGHVLAGNIPMVGFHDLLATFITGHKSIIKCSSKDKVLIPFIIDLLAEIDARTSDYFSIVDKLKNIDAVIATGGNTAATHFTYYFSKYPNIIRKNRSGVGFISQEDTTVTLSNIGIDIFSYFGLGCRSVSKLYVPREFDVDIFYQAILPFQYLIDHHKYKNNYDYSYSIYLLNKAKFYTNNFLILTENESLSSRIACLNFEYYDDELEVIEKLKLQKDDIQCISSTKPLGTFNHIPFGQCQAPGLSDYADNVDTVAFLLKSI